MKQKIFFQMLLCISMMTGMAMNAGAQIQVSAGVGGGVNIAQHYIGEDNDYYGFNPLVTAQVDLQFSRLLAMLFWIEGLSGMSFNPDLGDGYDYRYSINYVGIAPTLKFCFPRRPLYVYAGPGFGFNTTGKVRQSYADGFGFTENISDMEVRIDARMGVGYDIFLNRRLTLSPFVGFNLGLNDVVTGSSWTANIFQGGIVLRYNVN
ncbi:MAG: PorT family protein [Tannerella sp.]|jgi:hypothetical protein|nr:PorT family protein [Tannerella sp.]